MVRLYGIAEIAAEIGDRRQTVAQWHKRGKLPPPSANLSMGPVWTQEDIGGWLARVQEGTTMTRWTALELVDGDGCGVTGERRLAALQEFWASAAINGVFFARTGLPHEDLEDASTWGPQSPAHVDWTGFPPHKQEGPDMMNRMTPAEAWDGYVGEQMPQEFVQGSIWKGVTDIDEMCRVYAADVPRMFELSARRAAMVPENLADLLAKYIRRTFRETAEALVAALNDYAEETDPAEANPWEDVIRRAQYAEYIDWPASEAIGSSDVVILLDGTRICYNHSEKTWRIG